MKQIPLTKGKFTIVDDEDYEKVIVHKWHTHKGNTTYYVATTPRGTKSNRLLLMHRFILDISDPKVHVDHINGNGLDNRRSNIRPCTPTQNNRNSSLPKNSTTGFKGVSIAYDNKYKVHLSHENNKLHIGTFDSKEHAALSYDFAARKLHGEFAKLNFPNIENYPAIVIAKSRIPNGKTIPNSTNKTGFHGVHINKKTQKFVSQITKNGHTVHLWTFISDIEAAKAYDKMAIKLNGSRARLNFP